MTTPDKPDISIDAADLDLDGPDLPATSDPESKEPAPGDESPERDRQGGGAG